MPVTPGRRPHQVSDAARAMHARAMADQMTDRGQIPYQKRTVVRAQADQAIAGAADPPAVPVLPDEGM